jgi:cobalt-zinc-cadmium efflux system outer membrane protein
LQIERALGPVVLLVAVPSLFAQRPLTWSEVRDRFLVRNPNLAAGALNIEEAKANQVTAGLRPNPLFALVSDQYQLFPSGGVPFRPLSSAQFIPSVSQLWERGHKRQLRVQSSGLAITQTESDQLDLRRTLTFSLRDAFNRTLTAKALLELAEQNLRYYNDALTLNRERVAAGDLARVDFARLELQLAQFESDLSTAQVNLRTAKIDLLALLNEHTPVDQFDVTGRFDFSDAVLPLPELEDRAVAARPDLRSAETAIRRAESDHRLARANGTWDPSIGGEYLWNPQVLNTVGFNLTIPIRIFDRNQGEKARTAVEITRTQRLRDQIAATVLHDVDASYMQLQSVRNLLIQYRDRYLKQSADVRDVVSFSYQHGGASLLDFLDAQKSYRDTQQAFRNLIGAYLTAVAQLNTAVGEEVIHD